MGKYTGERYYPSNSTEGFIFEDNFCSQCIHEKFYHTQKHGDKQCGIFNRALLYHKDEKQYPSEWQYDVNDNPVCTAHVHWNWGSSDDEGGLNLPPPPPPPDDPAQMCLPFEINEMEFEKAKELELCPA